jgi:hypothetical protein
MYITWIWTRLIVLPYSIWLIVFDYSAAIRVLPDTTYEVSYARSMMFVMSAMDFLYIYWFILLTQMLVNYVLKGSDEDLQQKVPGEARKKTN